LVPAPVLVLAQLTHAVTFAAHHVACIAQVTGSFRGGCAAAARRCTPRWATAVSGVMGGVGGGWLIGHLGFASVFWAAAVCAALALGCRPACACSGRWPFAPRRR
jgi:PPP family 3-phenylpropionic acid transporter